jgi:flagellar biosynthesis/type III secretory pathway protein FliH
MTKEEEDRGWRDDYNDGFKNGKEEGIEQGRIAMKKEILEILLDYFHDIEKEIDRL